MYKAQALNSPGQSFYIEAPNSRDESSQVAAWERLTRHLKPDIVEAFAGLYRNITNLLPEKECPIVQLLGSSETDGCSTVARELGLVLATKLGLSVLLVDAFARHPAQHHFFGIQDNHGPADINADRPDPAKMIHQVVGSPLHISSVSLWNDELDAARRSQWPDEFLHAMKSNFDLIVIDMPCVNRRHVSLDVLRSIDGVVLVVEAGRTRWQEACMICDSITDSGGTVLGVFLNKARSLGLHLI